MGVGSVCLQQGLQGENKSAGLQKSTALAVLWGDLKEVKN